MPSPFRVPPDSATGVPEFDYAPGQPNLYRLMRFKQDLVREHGLNDGFVRYKQTLKLPPTASIRCVEPAGERGLASEAVVFVETARGGENFVNEPPSVIGEGNHRPLMGVTRSQYVACFDRARVRGRSSAIQRDQDVLLDVQGGEADRFEDELEWDPVIFGRQGRSVWCIEGQDTGAPIEVDEAFTLLGAHTDFFGHWMCQYLPKYVAARLSGHLPDVPVLIDAHMPPAHRESLELLYPNGVAIVEVRAFSTVRVRRLWSAPALSYWPFHEVRDERFTWDAVSASGGRFAPVVRELQRRCAAVVSPSCRPTRVYLARKSVRHRCLVNGEAIERLAREAGLEIAYPEDLSFAEQVALVRDARVVVLPEGSALFLAMFAMPGTTVCILSHPLTDLLADYEALLAPHGIHVMALTGPISRFRTSSPNDSDYTIDESTFRQTIAAIVGRPPG